MSKGLEALEDIKNIKIGCHYKKGTADLIIDKVKDLFYHDVVEIEKELKALEIIKKKQVQIADLLDCIANEKADYVESGLVEYNGWHFVYRQLTQEEYNLLKEVLE